MLTRKIIGMVVGALVCVSIASGTTYYVDPNGSDDANGLSLETSFKTIQKAANTVNPGDTVLVREGTYYENGGLDIARYGTENNYITFKPYNNEQVIIAPSKTYDSWTSNGNGIYSRVFNDFIPDYGRLGKTDGYGITRVNTYEELLDPNISQGGIDVLNLNGMDANNVDLYYFDDTNNLLSVKLGSGSPNDVYVVTNCNRVEIGDVNTDAFIEINGFTIQYTYEGIKSYGNHCKIINNTVKHTSISSIFAPYGDDLLIQNNSISYTGAPLKYHPADSNLLIANNLDHSIYVKNTERVTIKNNTTGRCIGGPSVGCGSNDCEIYDNRIEGGYYGGAANNKIYNNIFTIKYNTLVGIILVGGSSDQQICNNTIIAPQPVYFSSSSKIENLTFKNNIAYSEGVYCMETGDVTMSSADINNNAYYGGSICVFRVGVYPDWEIFSDFDSYQAYMVSNYSLEANSFYANPDFIDSSNENYHLGLNSPCINAGNNNYVNWPFDIDGDVRICDLYVDIGADEICYLDAHWWKLDETSGTTAYDSVDTDNGAFNGNDPRWVTGKFDGAVDFNGVNDYFSVSSLDDAYDYGSVFTVTGWFDTNRSKRKQTIVGQWSQDSGDFYYGWQVLVENNKVVAKFGGDVAPLGVITGTSNINYGWHQFALVCNGYSGVVLYVDGESEATAGTPYVYLYDTKFRIGDGSYVSSGNPTLEGGPFNGRIDDVMIFNRVLSAEEVEQLYEDGL